MIIVIAVAYRRLGNFVEGAVGNSGSYFVIAVTRWRLGAGAGAVEHRENFRMGGYSVHCRRRNLMR